MEKGLTHPTAMGKADNAPPPPPLAPLALELSSLLPKPSLSEVNSAITDARDNSYPARCIASDNDMYRMDFPRMENSRRLLARRVGSIPRLLLLLLLLFVVVVDMDMLELLLLLGRRNGVERVGDIDIDCEDLDFDFVGVLLSCIDDDDDDDEVVGEEDGATATAPPLPLVAAGIRRVAPLIIIIFFSPFDRTMTMTGFSSRTPRPQTIGIYILIM